MIVDEQEASALARVRADAGAVFDALDRSGVAMVATDPNQADNPIVYVNRAFTRLTGYVLADVAGRNCRFLQAPGTDAATVASLRQAVAAGTDFSGDLLNQRQDGSLFWNRLSITAIRDAGGAPQLFLGTQTDVTVEHGRAILSGASGVWDWDVEADCLYGDMRFAELYGLDPRATFMGVPTSTFFEAVDPADQMRLRIAVAGAMRGVETFARDYRVHRADGSVRWVSARGRPHFNEMGETVRFTGMLADITDQKRVEEALRIAQTAGGIGSFDYICGFGTANVSGQFCRLIGVNETDALAVRTINGAVLDGQPTIIDVWDEVGAGHLPYTEIAIRGPDGKPRWLARRGDLIDEPTGKRFVGVIYDITTSKTAQTALLDLTKTLEQRVEERTRERDTVWNLSRDIYTITGKDGLLRSVNPAITEVLGYSPRVLVGTRLRDLIHPDDAPMAESAFQQLLSESGSIDFDGRMRAVDGEWRWINWSALSRDNEILGVGRDITQRKTLEDQLRQSQKMEAVGQLTGGLAHDFNNMLTGIIGGIDIIRRRIASGRTDDLGRFIDGAQTSAERAAALIHRLLAFSRQQSLDFKAVDVNALVESLAVLLGRTLGDHVQVELALDSTVRLAATDENQLESAILNLAINARDAMPEGGYLRIETHNTTLTAEQHPDGVPGEYVEISVCDTGAGMSPDVVAKVFEPFFTTKPLGQGTGLGLSMIYGFIRQSGGQVAVDSEVGRGTTIHLYLPRHQGEAPSAAPAASADLPRGNGQHVLVVEDDGSVRMLVMELLRDLGYAAISAADPATALDLIRSDKPFDLLITDVGLPGMNGRQMVEEALLFRPNLPVLFMTGYAEGATVRSEFLGQGMRMITKPFALDNMAAQIHQALQ